METKGLDIVRRDWCPLARAAGHAALQHILSGRDEDAIVEAVHELLRETAARCARSCRRPMRSRAAGVACSVRGMHRSPTLILHEQR